jgi:DNA-binding NarL/FixJ family response regulator
MPAEHIRVVVIDDHDLYRGGVIQLLRDHGIETVGEARLAAAGIELVCEAAPDVVLMDLNMPGMSGVEATQRLHAAAPLARVVVLTVVADEQSVTEAILAGACGYLLKDAPIAQMIEGIRAAARGESLISPRVASHLVHRLRQPAELERGDSSEMTARELEILELIARGMDNPEIAHTLFLSQHTVKNHVSSILVKMQVENRIQAAVRAVRRGLL